MEMRDTFPAVHPIVDHEPKSRFGDTRASRHLGGFEKEMPEQVSVCGARLGDPGDRLFGN